MELVETLIHEAEKIKAEFNGQIEDLQDSLSDLTNLRNAQDARIRNLKAIQGGAPLAIIYRDSEGMVTARIVSDYHLAKLKNGVALCGHCHIRADHRCFYLDRIMRLFPTE